MRTLTQAIMDANKAAGKANILKIRKDATGLSAAEQRELERATHQYKDAQSAIFYAKAASATN